MSHRITIPRYLGVYRVSKAPWYGWRCELCWIWSTGHFPTWELAYCDYIDHQKWVDGK